MGRARVRHDATAAVKPTRPVTTAHAPIAQTPPLPARLPTITTKNTSVPSTATVGRGRKGDSYGSRVFACGRRWRPTPSPGTTGTCRRTCRRRSRAPASLAARAPLKLKHRDSGRTVVSPPWELTGMCWAWDRSAGACSAVGTHRHNSGSATGRTGQRCSNPTVGDRRQPSERDERDCCSSTPACPPAHAEGVRVQPGRSPLVQGAEDEHGERGLGAGSGLRKYRVAVGLMVHAGHQWPSTDRVNASDPMTVRSGGSSAVAVGDECEQLTWSRALHADADGRARASGRDCRLFLRRPTPLTGVQRSSSLLARGRGVARAAATSASSTHRRVRTTGSVFVDRKKRMASMVGPSGEKRTAAGRGGAVVLGGLAPGLLADRSPSLFAWPCTSNVRTS